MSTDVVIQAIKDFCLATWVESIERQATHHHFSKLPHTPTMTEKILLDDKRAWVTSIYDPDTITFTDYGGWGERNESIISLCRLGYERIKCDIDAQHRIAIFTGDHAPPKNPFEGYKVFSMSNFWEKADRCFPCFSFMGWKDSGIDSFDQVVNEIKKRRNTPPKARKLFWIGNIGTHGNRVLFWRLARSHRDIIECQHMRWLGNGRGEPYVSLPDHTNYSMLIDIEGSGYSGRLKFLAQMNRTLFVQDRPLWDWAGAQLQPNVHFIPVARNFSDILTKLDDIKYDQGGVDNMVARCTALATDNLTKEKAIQQVERLLLL